MSVRLPHVADLLTRTHVDDARQPNDQLPNPQPQASRFRHVSSKPSLHTRLLLLHHKPTLAVLPLGKTQRALPHRYGISDLCLALLDRAGSAAKDPQPLGHVDLVVPGVRATVYPPRHCGRDEQERWIREDEGGGDGAVQHVCAGVVHHLVKHLPRAGQVSPILPASEHVLQRFFELICDRPYYFTGNKVLIAIVCYNIAAFVGCKVFYVTVNKYVFFFFSPFCRPKMQRLLTFSFVNRRRDEKWNAMSKEEKEHYLATTTDEGNKRLDFRFTH